MTIINIRGTSGSGKSTLARRIMALYANRVPNYAPGRRQPISYLLSGPGLRTLFVLGHYEVEGGGADNVPRRDVAFAMLQEAVDLGGDVLWEGVVYSDEVTRTVALCQRGVALGQELRVILLTTPVEQCLADIRARRERAGNVRPLNESNTRGRVAAIQRACVRLAQSGVPVERLGREEAFLRCAELLGLGGSVQQGQHSSLLTENA
jgi:hypothetical protein